MIIKILGTGCSKCKKHEANTRELIPLIVENEEAFKKLALSKTESLEETKQVIASLPGIKVELKDRVEVQFK